MLSLSLGGCNLSNSNSCGLQHMLHHSIAHCHVRQDCRQQAAGSTDILSQGCHASKRALRMTSQLCRHAVTWNPVNLADLQEALDRKKLNANELITMKTLRDAGVASKKIEHGVKLLAKVWLPTCESEHPACTVGPDSALWQRTRLVGEDY